MQPKYARLPLPAVNALVKYLAKQPWEDVNDFIMVLTNSPVEESAPVPPAPKNRVEAANEK